MSLLLFLAAAAAQPEWTTGPQMFVTRVYRQYRHRPFSPLEHPERWFTPELTAAIRADGAGGEVGYLDGDPLCDCQDYQRLSMRITNYVQMGPNKVSVGVHVDLGVKPSGTRDLWLQLRRTPSGWRIADVGTADHPSLWRALRRSNARR